MDAVRIRLFGDFTILYQDKKLEPSDSRSRKVWMLLAYMIYHRKSNIPIETFIDLLWNGDETVSNPTNALKTVFHRLRSLLDQLGTGMGHRLILRHATGYAFNPDVPIELDIDDFEACFANARKEVNPETRLALSLSAFELYSHDFLPKYAAEPWVIPISAYYHNLYLQLVYETLDLLVTDHQSNQAVYLCRRAVQIEPYDETLYAHLIRNLLYLGEQHTAQLTYESFSKLLFDEFGVTPSEELRALHGEYLRTTQKDALDLPTLTKEILSQTSDHGALYCELDLFKAIYCAQSRMVSRSGLAIHVALLTITAADGSPLSKRSLERCMENLRPLTCDALRRGDIVSGCSASQYILLLPNTNYENACLVVDRIIRRFGRQYPHSPGFLRYRVEPISPS